MRRFYHDDLLADNIHYLGFVDVNSAMYRCLKQRCLFNILPSCSEGMATSCLTGMFAGMIPVVTEEVGVDIEDFGFLIEDVTPEGIARLVQRLSALPAEELKLRSEKAYQCAAKNHTAAAFQAELDAILDEVL